MNNFQRQLSLFLSFAYILPGTSWSEVDAWSDVCQMEESAQQFKQLPSVRRNDVKGAVYLEADQGSLNRTGVSSLEGDVSIRKDGVSLEADKADYNRQTDEVKAQGNVQFLANDLGVQADTISLVLGKSIGSLESANYQFKKSGANGESRKIQVEGKDKTLLKDATFTTCPVGKKSWHIAASEIKLDHTFNIGVAENLSFNVGKYPLLYLPRMSFALDEQRKSGFLTPTLSITESMGVGFATPYYFNLASNYDLTVTPGISTKGGLRLGSEFRYLTKRSKGKINYDMIPADREYDNEYRGLVEIEHETRLSNQSRITVKARDVSDKDYFDDFAQSLEDASIGALERRIDFSRQKGSWDWRASMQDYQIIDSGDAPYSRLPEINVSYKPEAEKGSVKYELNSELVNFNKEGADNGVRLDFHARASKKVGDYSWYLEPSLEARKTFYSLDTGRDQISRFLPTLSLDYGMFFERPLEEGGIIQTLEPRLFYTYTPYKDQSNIPLFDSALTSFGTSTKLFSANRFTGKDRIGDTNQLTAALTSRLFDTKGGREWASLSVGQIFYFDDRKVAIEGESTDTSSRSELALELSGYLSERVRLVSTMYWDTDDRDLSTAELRLHYKDPKKRIVNLGYRYLENELQQARLSFAVPIKDNWAVVGKVDHDLLGDRNLETLGGVEYSSCCWKARLAARNFLSSDNVNYENGVFLEFELKGLGSVGNGAKRLLEEKIYGYQ